MKQVGLDAINLIMKFLTTTASLATDWQPDGIVWCGNSLPITGQQAVSRANQYQVPLILSGGQGHATHYLLKQLPTLHQQVTEAASMASWLQANLPTPRLILDATSTNSGENASHSLKIMQPLHWQRVLLIQDPLLQLRTLLTFQHQAPQLDFKIWSPILQVQSWEPFRLNDSNYHWPRGYFVGLLLGELDRLANTATGYGPNGLNFINACELPTTVLQAKTTLQKLNLNTIR